MDQLIRFGLGSAEVYRFNPARQLEYQDNFSNIKQQSVAVPGLDGVIPPYGLGRGVAEAGNVSVRFWLFADEIHDMGHKLSEVRGLGYLGMRRLFKLAQNGELLWTFAMLSSVQTPQVVRRQPHYRNNVQMTFQCHTTRWYGAQDVVHFFNDDWTFGDGLVFPALKVDQEAVSNGSTVSVTNRGNAPVSAYVRWDGNGSNSFVNPVLTRRNWVEDVADQLTWTGTIGANDVVEIDARGLSCTNRSKLTTVSGGWLTIPAGTWELEVAMDSGSGLLTVDFWDGWV